MIIGPSPPNLESTSVEPTGLNSPQLNEFVVVELQVKIVLAFWQRGTALWPMV